MKFKITPEWLKEKGACERGYKWFIGQDESDATTVMRKLVKERRGADAVWVFSKLADKQHSVRLAVFAAELVLPIFEKQYPNDKRPRKAIDAAKVWLQNPTDANANAARDAADAAYAAAYAADACAYAAAYAADACAYAAAYTDAYAAYEKIVEEAIRILELEN